MQMRPDPAWLAAECARLLDFSADPRHPRGGFAWLDDDGLPDLDRPVELWITCRTVHVHAIGHLLGRAGSAALVDHGLAALSAPGGLLRDHEHGGWWARVGADGPLTRSKTAYEHAFVVLAGASATAAGRPGGRALLDDALDVLLNRFWDDDAGMVVEEWDAAWTVLDGYRGLNAAMHTVEALLAAADVLDGDDPAGAAELRARALRSTERVLRDLAPSYDGRLPEHFDAAWTPDLAYHRDRPADPFRPAGATVGHWCEWARLALHLRAALVAQDGTAPGWLLPGAEALFAAAVRDGWAADGHDGFCYTVDFDGRPIVRQRMHWVLAEAVSAAAALHAATGDPAYAERHAAWWAWAEAHLLDRERGSWHHELAPDGTPDDATWPGKPDLYHAVGATLVPRLPLAPGLVVALRDGLLDGGGG